MRGSPVSNAKNQLLELLAQRGLPDDCAAFTGRQPDPGAPWTSTVMVTLPGRPPITGSGMGARKTQADIAAAADALQRFAAEATAEVHDWSQVYADAQAGDALLKLAAYLATELTSPEDRSRWLQGNESDASLAQVFDRWFEEGAPELKPLGRGLGEKNKATMVEAVIWRRYRARVLGPGAAEALQELRAILGR